MNRRGGILEVVSALIIAFFFITWALDIDTDKVSGKINSSLDEREQLVCPAPVECPDVIVKVKPEPIIEYIGTEAPEPTIDPYGTGY